MSHRFSLRFWVSLFSLLPLSVLLCTCVFEYVCADACGHSYHRVAFIFIACSQRNALALVCLCVSAHQINYFYFDFIEVSLFSSVVACYQSQITPTCLLCPSICFYLISLWLAPHLVSACSLFCINLLVFQFYEGSVLLLSPASLSYQSFQVFFYRSNSVCIFEPNQSPCLLFGRYVCVFAYICARFKRFLVLNKYLLLFISSVFYNLRFPVRFQIENDLNKKKHKIPQL